MLGHKTLLIILLKQMNTRITSSMSTTILIIQTTIYLSFVTFCISGFVDYKPKEIKNGMDQPVGLIGTKRKMGPPIENSFNTPKLSRLNLNNKNHSSRKLQAEYIDYKDMDEELEDEDFFIDDDDLTTAQRFKRHWKRVLSRCLILLAILLFIILFCRCLLATVCTLILPNFTCLPGCEKEKDTMYVKVQEMGKTLGMEINRESYEHLLEICEDEGMTAIKHVKRV